LSRFKIPNYAVGSVPGRAGSSMPGGLTKTGSNHGTPKREVEVCDTEEQLADSLAKYTADLSDKLSNERGYFTMVLPGGSVVKSLRKLVEPPYVDQIEWSKWHVFWVDETVVPKDHEDCNYKLAFDCFLSRAQFLPGNVYTINEALSPEGAAEDYETCLRHLVNTGVVDRSPLTGFPKFDLMLLDIGPDGHVASLFPGHPLVKENEKWVTWVKDSPNPPLERITFTLPVINSSAHVALVVRGAGKADAVSTALGNRRNSDALPVQLVSPEGEVRCMKRRRNYRRSWQNTKLVEPPYVHEIDWSKWYIFWVDERAVGWEHADSNYKLANEGFLSKVKKIPAGNVCAISDELGKACETWTPGGAEKAAIDYEEQLHKWVDSGVLKKSSNGFPKFDLQLLGMGPDGHMASLFPGHPQINEKEKWVTYITDSPKPPKWRITLTLPVINSSSYIVFVMVGDGEAEAVGKVLGKSPPDVPLPAARASAEIEQNNRNYTVYDTVDNLREALAKYVSDLSDKFIRRKGSFTVVLSGGYLIDQLSKLVERPYHDKIEWSKWYIYWVDERVVGWKDPDSNYKLAMDGFLSKVPIPSDNICAIDNDLGEKGEAKAAAIDYEQRLKNLVEAGVIPTNNSGYPVFDLELLGMGPDGHMASLFPYHPQIDVKDKWITYITNSPKLPPKRITFTLPVINASPYIVFVMVGDGEAEAVCQVLGTCSSNYVLPASRASAEELAKYVARLSDECITNKNSFTVVLSGGSLIDHLRKLVESPYVDDIEWSKWYIYWVDERVVGWDDPHSNFKLSYDGFLSKVPIPPGNICAIDNELGKNGSAEAAAQDYENHIATLVSAGLIDTSPDGFPKFDLQLLGMGPDGHMASLFPNHPQIEEDDKWVTYITDSPKPPPKRITFTLPVINASPYIVFVMAGDGEVDAVCQVLGNCTSSYVLPASRASAVTEQKWFLDKFAAGKLL
ncbi:hypothetical protein Tsubulata_006177, partial [Turnera subulata]